MGSSGSSRHDERMTGQAMEAAGGVACPKCGSGRTAVTVEVADGSDALTLYCCGICRHRFSRSLSSR